MSSTELIIAPENLEVANAFLETGSYEDAAQKLGLPLQEVADAMKTPEVKRYVDAIYLDRGYRNRFTLAAALDELIDAKLAEMEENELTSKKDVSELMHLSHKMAIDHRKLDIEEMKHADKQVTPVVAIQNVGDSAIEADSNLGALMKKLIVSEQ